MRIGAAQPAASVPARDVAPKLTAVSKSDLRDAIGRAFTRVTGRAPTTGVLDVLTAHASLETASGSRMYNFNFGGIKGKGPTGETAVCQTHEVLNGKDVVIHDGFRAYRSLDEGATDYVRLMQGRFGGAVSAAERGDVDGFAHALKQSGYYTANETTYASALHGLVGDGGATVKAAAPAGTSLSNTNIAAALGGASPSALPDTAQIERLMDALSHHPRIVEDDDDSE